MLWEKLIKWIKLDWWGNLNKLNYFIWGKVDGESKSFYLNPNQLEEFMKKQYLSRSTIA